jgi:N-acyl-D-amino-acid deacylase
MDGSGAPGSKKNVAIRSGRIIHAGSGEVLAREVLEAEGLCVTPGFIDTHSHSDFTLLADPGAAKGKLFQGVTTEINGNCGLSGGPLLGEARSRREDDLGELSIVERWESLDDYLALVAKTSPYMNFATLAGHGNLRGSVIGYSDRPPTVAEMAAMKALLAESVSAGALGLSTGLIYPPGAYSDTGELSELAAHGKGLREGFVYATHMRSEGDRLLEALEEAVQIGEKAGALHVSHIKTSGRANWRKIDGAIALLEGARARGLAATADRYPYTAAATDLDAVLPSWVYDGGTGAELRRLKDLETARKIKSEIGRDDEYWRGVFVSDTARNDDRWAEGKSIAEISEALGMAPLDAVFRLLIGANLRVGAIFHGMNEDNLRRFLRLPWVMVGSDSSARSFEGVTARGRPHPRSFGTFPRFVKRYTMESGTMTLEEAVRRMTHLAARTFGLAGRGLIKEGWWADIAVFDPERFADTATYAEPFSKAEGLVHLVVNGQVTIKDGELTGRRGGRVLRHGLAGHGP